MYFDHVILFDLGTVIRIEDIADISGELFAGEF